MEAPLDGLIELDTEISSFESHLRKDPAVPLGIGAPPSGAGQESVLRKLLFRKKLPTHPERPTADSASKGAMVTCRVCDTPVAMTDLEEHTEWCSDLQDCLARRSRYLDYLNIMAALLGGVGSRNNEGLSEDELGGEGNEDEALLELTLKALEMDEMAGKNAAIRLARLLYRITKYTPDRNHAHYRRLQYIVRGVASISIMPCNDPSSDRPAGH